MTQKQKRLAFFNSIPPKIRLMISIAIVTIALNSCFLKQDRTTVVYGTISDQNGQPVDSIFVFIDGTNFLTQDLLKGACSDSSGNYELLVDVPKKYGSVDVGIPFGLIDNPKYDKNYKGKYAKKDDQPTNNCCHALIGKKTKYDFQLIPR